MTNDLTVYEPRTKRQMQLREMSTRGGDDCIEWPFAKCRRYGWLNWSGKKNLPAHRLAFLFQHGPIPGSADVMHLCNNKPCVNLNHLRPGSRSQNLQAAFDDGLRSPVQGEAHGRSKLTAADVARIRSSPERGVDLAVSLGVGRALISKIRQNTLWRHV